MDGDDVHDEDAEGEKEEADVPEELEPNDAAVGHETKIKPMSREARTPSQVS